MKELKRNYAGLDDYNHAAKARVDGWNSCLDYLATNGYFKTPADIVDDLLAALKQVLHGLELRARREPDHKGLAQDLETVRAAIAKATGGAK